MTSAKVAYLGADGAYAETAAKNAFTAGELAGIHPCHDLASLEECLKSTEASHGLVVVENTLSGTFTSALDFLIHRPHLHVVGEVVVKESNALLAHEMTELQNITDIVASPQSIDHCRSQLLESLQRKDIAFRVVPDVLSFVDAISQGKHPNTAVIADPSLANKFKLKVIQKQLGELKEHNFTRYFLIANQPVSPERHQLPKTTVAITLKNTPGALMKVFSVFALRDINVCKVESRASARSVRGNSAWEYTMVVDVDGAPQVDTKLSNALKNLNEFSTNVHVLGSYPRFFPSSNNDLAPVGL